ncbi:hypothetical protein HJC23_009883 [Cyclotella cryptica]|uniref:Uncharacterized protein n=1 Tax=Cyclotella cryptica TaxID=29204 RepID=A0ABD3QC87_9STRA
MSITRSYRYHQENIHAVQPHELKLRDEILKTLVNKSQAFPNEVDEENRDEEVESPMKYATLSDTKSEYTTKKLHRIKRRLFLDAVNSSHVQGTSNYECNCGSPKTRGRE